jgi:hypothetical protein
MIGFSQFCLLCITSTAPSYAVTVAAASTAATVAAASTACGCRRFTPRCFDT